MQEIASQRNNFIDFLKGCLIILVVYGHVVQYFDYHDQDFFSDPVFRAIYIFHMPLFMVVSGYLAKPTFDRYVIVPFFVRKFRQLIVPVLCWSILFTFFSRLLVPESPNGIAILRFIIHSYLNNIAGIWFIWALFLGFTTVYLARLFKQRELLALIMLNGLILLIPNFSVLDYCKFVLPYFCVGYLIARHFSEVRFSNVWYLLCVISSILIFLIWKPQFFIYVSGMRLTATNIPIILARFVAGLVYSSAIYETLRRLYKFIPSQLLSFLGKHTLIIYILQAFFMRIGIQMPLINHLVFYVLLGPVVTFIIIYCILQVENILTRTVWTRRYLLGQESRIA